MPNENSDSDALVEMASQRYMHLGDIVLSLATGAITISATFRDALAGHDATWLFLLPLAWLSLAVAIGLFFFQAHAEIDHIRCIVFEGTMDERNTTAGKLLRLRKWMYAVFCLGLGSLILFATLNLPRPSGSGQVNGISRTCLSACSHQDARHQQKGDH
ncbi:MAG: hypothetical protein RBU25_14045 [Lentisphaeria bacterium]|jgi:hypothetical protein|nr:hypothetical protein [Lentisphaeria bacterium]